MTPRSAARALGRRAPGRAAPAPRPALVAPPERPPAAPTGAVPSDQAALPPAPRPGPAASSPAALLRRLGLRPRKGLSQSFLVDRRVCATIARAAALDAADAVLEVGPGLGVLTAELVRHAGRVVAIELDKQLATALPALLGQPANLRVIQGDALHIAPEALFDDGYKLVANLPYHITSPLLMHVLQAARRPRLAVVMVQREVAERIAAPPGDLSYLAVAVQLYATPRIVRTVPAAAFYPRPRVESAVLRLDVRPAPAVVPDAPATFLRFVQAGFKQPRKHLRNSLAEGLGCRPIEAEALLRQADLDPARRPQTLTLDEWARLYEAWRATSPGEGARSLDHQPVQPG
ncbi:MAG TPA: 16S rRNA (adenine(1518)-N(6)/adenine(1519)-N(6))-dimethyltransferase RsmA [Chloroflexota bacterium]|nr:16S rRNA (adenine(1518)-N(6)/adenine(1519)-N(6))-dimethyltransferase RsmA [Chloroflexota bacterium]